MFITNEQKYAYQLLHDAYYGSGLFSLGRGLKQHPRESIDNYNFRKKLSSYSNHTAAIINANVDPIFNDEIRREYKETAKFKVFLKDADRLGTSLQEYIQQQALIAKMYGVVYVIVNNEAEFGESLADNVRDRRLPYLTSVEPSDVTGWKLDDKGRIIRFEYRAIITDDNGGSSTVYYEWTDTKWTIRDKGRGVINEGEHGLGRVPVVQWFGRSTKKTTILPHPEFYSLAQKNYRVYHLDSLLTQILNSQTFSTLTMPSDEGIEDLTLGVNNVLLYPSEASHPPAFIAPDNGPAQIIMQEKEAEIKEMYRIGGVDSVVGVQQEKSGVAKQWAFKRTNQRLANFAVQCENAEKAIIALYELWTGEQLNYKCEYPRDFDINDVADCLSQGQQALDLGFKSKTYYVEILKRILDGYMPNIDGNVYDAIVKEVEATAQQEVLDDMYSNGKNPDENSERLDE